MKKRMDKKERERLKTRLMEIMFDHVGRSKRIGMGELYEKLFNEKFNNRINDTRPLRILITELRKKGIAICSDASTTAGGYYVASAGSELKDYTRRDKMRALKILKRVANMEKTTLPALLGQIQVNLGLDGAENG